MTSSSNYSSNLEATSNNDEVNKGLLQFPNKICFCGIKSSKSTTNPKRLYYKRGKDLNGGIFLNGRHYAMQRGA